MTDYAASPEAIEKQKFLFKDDVIEGIWGHPNYVYLKLEARGWKFDSLRDGWVNPEIEE